MWFITQRCQTLFCCWFSSMKICNRSVFCFSSINCNTYMSNLPVTLSEISHLSISGLQRQAPSYPHSHDERLSFQAANGKLWHILRIRSFMQCFIFSRTNTLQETPISIFWNYFWGKKTPNALEFGGCKENCTTDKKNIAICREHCLKWPLLLLQPFLCIGTIKDMDLVFLFVHFHNLGLITVQHIVARSVFMSLNILLHFLS